MGLAVLGVAGAACGRIAFDPLSSSDAGGPDGNGLAPAIAQVVAPGYVGAASQTIAIDQTAGNFLLVATYWNQNADTVAVSDTLGNAYQNRPVVKVPLVCGGGTGDSTVAQLWYAPITTTGTNMVTVAQSVGVQPLGMMLLEYTGVALADPIAAGSELAASMSSHTATAKPVVTTATTTIVAFFGDTIGNGAMGGGPGYTVEARDLGFPNMIEDLAGPAGTYTPTATLPGASSDACWVASAVALRGR